MILTTPDMGSGYCILDRPGDACHVGWVHISRRSLVPRLFEACRIGTGSGRPIYDPARAAQAGSMRTYIRCTCVRTYVPNLIPRLPPPWTRTQLQLSIFMATD